MPDALVYMVPADRKAVPKIILDIYLPTRTLCEASHAAYYNQCRIHGSLQDHAGGECHVRQSMNWWLHEIT